MNGSLLSRVKREMRGNRDRRRGKRERAMRIGQAPHLPTLPRRRSANTPAAMVAVHVEVRYAAGIPPH